MSRLVPLLLDAAFVLLFATVGRRSHAEGVTVSGVLHTAWPFLVGTAAGWLLASVALEAGPNRAAVRSRDVRGGRSPRQRDRRRAPG